MPFDPVSFAIGAKAASGGGGGGGGFTLLHGTYSITQDDEEIITLGVTASELYALMQTSAVAFDYTSQDSDFSQTPVDMITYGRYVIEDGYEDAYEFLSGRGEATNHLGADDAVVFFHGGK